jgi:hypothetical protein
MLTGEWTPFLGAGVSYATGFDDRAIESEGKSGKVKLLVEQSPFLQFAGGVNYTGTDGFVFTATTGYSLLLKKGGNTSYVSGSKDSYDEVKPLFGGGLIVSVAFGYAFH